MLRVWWKFVGISQIFSKMLKKPDFFLKFLANVLNFDRTLMWKIRMVRSLADRTFQLRPRRRSGKLDRRTRPSAETRHPKPPGASGAPRGPWRELEKLRRTQADEEQQHEPKTREVADKPPKSLEAKWLHQMFKVSGSSSRSQLLPAGIWDFEQFRQTYASIEDLVVHEMWQTFSKRG